MSLKTGWEKFKSFVVSIVKAFVMKDGEISKTAILLSLVGLSVVFIYFVESLFCGLNLWGWVIPEFDAMDATAVIGTISTLYVMNHSKFIKGGSESVEELAATKEKIDEILARMAPKAPEEGD